MARSTFFYHIKQKQDKYEEVCKKITDIYARNKGRYGYRRICIELRSQGICINHKTVARLMQEMSLQAKRKVRHYRSYKGQIGKTAPNVLERDFSATGPNQKWATDVSQVNIKDRKCYLSTILDLWNGEIVSFTISDSPNLKMVTEMLKKAFDNKANYAGLIMHSDQGWHYQHKEYQNMLQERGIVQSMSRKGNCLDNSMMENFFGLMKNELLYVNSFDDIKCFKKELEEYISYYNNKRIKLRLGMSPVQYRKQHQNK